MQNRPTTACLMCFFLLFACEENKAPRPARQHLGPASQPNLARVEPTPTNLPAPPPARVEKEEPPEQAPGAGTRGQPRGDYWLDEAVDVAAAGPAAATRRGVVFRLRDDSLRLAPLLADAARGSREVTTPVKALELDKEQMVALERGPTVLGSYAYFVSASRLVRAKIPNGELEVLATDARPFTRVAAVEQLRAEDPVLVGYVARHPSDKDTLLARLWVEGKGTFTLTPDGSAGNTVALARAADVWVALSLESRTGMSPLHARRIGFGPSAIQLSPDVVVWVAGTAQPLTEVFALAEKDELWGFLPIERAATEFGLARVDVGSRPVLSSEVSWRIYPNGLEPAVVATGHLCGEPVVIYARPATDVPHAPQELHVSPVRESGLGPGTLVATSQAFADVSYSSLDGGGLFVYVADRRTWARRFRCAH